MPTTKKTETTQTQSQNQTQTQSGSNTQTNNQSWNNNYDQASMDAYHTVLPAWQSKVQSLISNPFDNPWLHIAQGMQQNQIGAQMAGQKATLMNNLRQGGMGGGSPFALAQLGKLGRAGAGMNAQANNNLLMQSWGSGMDALKMAQGFSPLVTGGNQSQTQTQSYNGTTTGNMTGSMSGSSKESTGGIGTWLAPAVGIGLGLATGGLSGLGQSAAQKAAGQPMKAPNAPGPFQGPFNVSAPDIQQPFGGLGNPLGVQGMGGGMQNNWINQYSNNNNPYLRQQ